MFHNPGNFCNYRIFELFFLRKLWVRIKLFEFDNYWEIFEKSSEHYKKMPYFLFNICFKTTKNTLQNGQFKFLRRWPHIFYMLFENHMTWFCDFWPKIIGNISKISLISVQKFQTYFSGIISWKYWECHLLLYSNMSSFCFFVLVYTLNHNFCNETTVWQKSIEALFYPELKKNYFTEICQIGKPTHPPRKIYFIKGVVWVIFDILEAWYG
jgi:hypothetical protein